jgi:molecular chaperone DnaK (HSP70)
VGYLNQFPENIKKKSISFLTMSDEDQPGIIGIDFGGISSSAAFALDNGQNPELKVLEQWPKATPRFPEQVPDNPEIESIVYYDQRFKMVGWSEDEENAVITPQGGTKPGLYVFRNFKSDLFPPKDYPEELKASLRVPGRTPEDITVDYLRHLRVSILSQVQRQRENLERGQGNLRVMMTTPSFWNEEAKAGFREIATDAGFEAKPDEKLDLISGLEAAILHAEFVRPAAFPVGEIFLVVDCGGHFVEAAAFEVHARNPFRLEKRTEVSASSCGSAEVTRRFLNIMNDKIGRTGIAFQGQTKPRMRHRCRKQFEKEVLLQLGRATFQPPSEDLSDFWVADLGVEIDCPEADLTEGYMSFREDEVYSCFDFAVERTLELVKEQIAAVRVQGLQLQGFLLVGGFNKCVYYSDRVQTGIAALGLGTIQSDHDPLAFAKGAVLAGLKDSFGHI